MTRGPFPDRSGAAHHVIDFRDVGVIPAADGRLVRRFRPMDDIHAETKIERREIHGADGAVAIRSIEHAL